MLNVGWDPSGQSHSKGWGKRWITECLCGVLTVPAFLEELQFFKGSKRETKVQLERILITDALAPSLWLPGPFLEFSQVPPAQSQLNPGEVESPRRFSWV